jgi:antitoxin component of MazEF toxin-antitoxin module
MRKSGKHPVWMKTSLYVNIPFFIVDQLQITEKSDVQYLSDNGVLVIKVKKQQEPKNA